MLPKKGKELHRRPRRSGADGEFEQAIAAALKGELGSTHRTIKTVMRWTGASERTVKHWFAGTHGPSGQNLIALARHSERGGYVFPCCGKSAFLVGRNPIYEYADETSGVGRDDRRVQWCLAARGVFARDDPNCQNLCRGARSFAAAQQGWSRGAGATSNSGISLSLLSRSRPVQSF